MNQVSKVAALLKKTRADLLVSSPLFLLFMIAGVIVF